MGFGLVNLERMENKQKLLLLFLLQGFVVLAQDSVFRYYDNGNLKSKGVMANQKQQGLWHHYYPDGTLNARLIYHEGLLHGKAEYFSSIVEGVLILVAAGGIAYTAIQRLFAPQPLEQLGIGLVVSLAATGINFTVARILLSAGKKYRSITLEADSHHLMTDVWTSAAVIGGVAAVGLTGWLALDSLVAIAVAANIVWTAIQLLRRSVAGLMDASLPPEDIQAIEGALASYRGRGIDFHALLTRQGAARRFVSVHVLVPGQMTVHDAHRVAEDIESDIRKALPDAVVITHLEPVDDEISLHDIPIDR